MDWFLQRQSGIFWKCVNFTSTDYKEKHLWISLSKSWWYDPQFLRYRVEHTEIGNFRSFFALIPPKKPQNQNFETWNNLLEISSFYMCTKNHNCMMHSSCDMEWDSIVSSRSGTSPFLREPSSFWSKFKKLSPSFWQPSKLVHVNCIKHFKMKMLCFVLYKSIENVIIITLYTFRLNSVFTADTCFG